MTPPAHAETFLLNNNGGFTYRPVAGWIGIDQFTYRAFDGVNYSQPATVKINVTDQSPTAMPQFYSVVHDHTLNVPAAGVLLGATDPENDNLTAVLVTPPGHSQQFTLQPNGSFTYQPATGWAGTDTFTFRATDGIAQSALQTATITVTDAAPMGMMDAYTAIFNTPLNVPALGSPLSGVLANDTDTDGNLPLSAVLVAAPQHGSLEFHPDGSFIYTPEGGYEGSDSFTYRPLDGVIDATIGPVAGPITFVFLQIQRTTVDLEIADGQGGSLLSEAAEDSRGAYTVANKNDSDGDGRPDIADDFVRSSTTTIVGGSNAGSTVLQVQDLGYFEVGDSVVVYSLIGPTERHTVIGVNATMHQLTIDAPLQQSYLFGYVSHGGRDEVDLMQLRINRPSVYTGGPVTLRINSGNVRIWENPSKGQELSFINGEAQVFPNSFSGSSRSYWVEALDASASLRDIELRLEYAGVNDSVRATSIWVSIDPNSSDVLHNATDQVWADMTATPGDTIQAYGGFGLIES